MNEKRERQIRGLREGLKLIVCFATALVIAICVRIFVFELVQVDGDSMRPTLYDGQLLFVEKISLRAGGIERGDVVIVNYPNREGAFVKRVIGLAGDTVEVKDGKLYVNGQIQEESYTLEETMFWDTEQTVVPLGCYYVMGDNRNDSTDSRSVGPIAREDMIGKALFVIWPIGSIHGLS